MDQPGLTKEAGRPPRASERVDAACDHFEHMGAELKLAHARERTAKLEQRLLDEGIIEPAASEKPRPRRRPSMDRELQRRVQWALTTLSEDDREVILMKHFEQLSNQEIAAILCLSEPATSMRYLRALRRLKAALHSNSEG